MADSDRIAGTMNELGYDKADNLKKLTLAKNPVLIFNTCSIRQKAEDRVFGLNNRLRELKGKN